MGRSLEAISSGLNPVNDAVHTYTDAINAVNYAKSVPGRVGAVKDKAVTGVKNWYTDSVEAGKHGMTRKQYHAERAATPAGETAQTGGRAAETAETAAPAAERTAASETAADGGVSELANAGAAGREATAAGEQAAGREATAAGEQAAGREATTAGEAAADGGVSELANAGAAGREATAAGEQAAGREAAATGTLSNYERQQYNSYINMVQNDSGLVDLVQPTLDRVVGSAGRSIDSLSDAELSAFYKALNDAVNDRWVGELFFRGQN